MSDRTDIPLGYTRDAQGNILTYRNSDGYWCECTCDGQGRELTYRNSAAFDGVKIADDGAYALFHDTKQGLFIAGCRRFNRADALKHWSREDARAKLFTAAILATA